MVKKLMEHFGTDDSSLVQKIVSAQKELTKLGRRDGPLEDKLFSLLRQVRSQDSPDNSTSQVNHSFKILITEGRGATAPPSPIFLAGETQRVLNLFGRKDLWQKSQARTLSGCGMSNLPKVVVAEHLTISIPRCHAVNAVRRSMPTNGNPTRCIRLFGRVRLCRQHTSSWQIANTQVSRQRGRNLEPKNKFDLNITTINKRFDSNNLFYIY